MYTYFIDHQRGFANEFCLHVQTEGPPNPELNLEQITRKQALEMARLKDNDATKYYRIYYVNGWGVYREEWLDRILNRPPRLNPAMLDKEI